MWRFLFQICAWVLLSSGCHGRSYKLAFCDLNLYKMVGGLSRVDCAGACDLYKGHCVAFIENLQDQACHLLEDSLSGQASVDTWMSDEYHKSGKSKCLLRSPMLVADVSSLHPSMRFVNIPAMAVIKHQLLISNLSPQSHHQIALVHITGTPDPVLVYNETSPAPSSTISAILLQDDVMIVLHKDGTLKKVDLPTRNVIDAYTIILPLLQIVHGILFENDSVLFSSFFTNDIWQHNMTSNTTEVRIGGIFRPKVLALYSSAGQELLYITYMQDNVLVYNLDWILLHNFGAEELGVPFYVITAPRDTVWVVDYSTQTTKEFTLQGNYTRDIIQEVDGVPLPVQTCLDYPYAWVTYYNATNMMNLKLLKVFDGEISL